MNAGTPRWFIIRLKRRAEISLFLFPRSLARIKARSVVAREPLHCVYEAFHFLWFSPDFIIICSANFRKQFVCVCVCESRFAIFICRSHLPLLSHSIKMTKCTRTCTQRKYLPELAANRWQTPAQRPPPSVWRVAFPSCGAARAMKRAMKCVSSKLVVDIRLFAVRVVFATFEVHIITASPNKRTTEINKET